MHLSQAVAIIQSQLTVIKGAQVLYSEAVNIFFKKRSNSFFPTRNGILTTNVSLKPESVKCGHRDKYAIGWDSLDFRFSGTALKGTRGVQYEIGQT